MNETTIQKFNKLYEYFFHNSFVLDDDATAKTYLYNEAFNIIEKTTDNNLKENILGDLIILFPKDVSLYCKMGELYKNANIQKSVLWHNMGFSIDPLNEENTIKLCMLYFEKGFTKKVSEMNKNHLFKNFFENENFITIYVTYNFNNLYYKVGIPYLLKLIEKRRNYICFTPEEKKRKWGNYHDAGYVYAKMAQHEKSIEYTKIAVKLSLKFCLDMYSKLLSFSNIVFYSQYIYFNHEENYELHKKTNDYFLDKTQMAVKNENSFKKKIEKNKNQSNKKIRIGYVSGDYKHHPICNFMIPILENYDKNKFEIFLYANQKTNEVIDLFTSLKLNTYYILEQTDEAVSNLIIEHKIDILIDLSGHSIMNRLGVFALNSAPIQITYLGYPNSTGLKTVKYRITDHIADNDFTKQKYTEKLIRLPRCFLLYKSVIEPIPKIPKKTEDTIILAAINKEDKNSKYVLYAWKEILKNCPNTKIMIKLETFDNNEERMDFYTKKLETTSERIIIINKLQNKEYGEIFTKFDILLDTFPYSGTTTTCNSLHNSVPVVTLYNKDYHSHNVSSSILMNSSLPELIAYSVEEYIEIVKDLVNDKTRIDNYKKEIGDKFKKSMEPKLFMKDYEEALINVYNKYYFNESVKEMSCVLEKFSELNEKSKIFQIKEDSHTNEEIKSTTLYDIDFCDHINDIQLDVEKIYFEPTNHTNSVLFISVFDYGSLELGLNHLFSLKKANIYNYMAFVTDEKSYEVVSAYGFNVTKIEKPGAKNIGEKNFGEKDFIEFSFLRYKIINEELKKYEAVWYMDVDTVVLQDLNKHYEKYKNGKIKYDIIYQNDIHELKHCGGCVLFFSNSYTLRTSEILYNGINNDIPDQQYANNFLEKYGDPLTIGLFETHEFPNGLLYFDNEDLIELCKNYTKEKERYKNKIDKQVAFVHANWMIGNDNKIKALKKKNLWFMNGL